MSDQYVEVDGTTPLVYPYTFGSLQAENPYTNYGDNWDFLYWFPMTEAATIKGYKLEPVTVLPQPSYDPYTQNCNPAPLPELIDGVWFDAWVITTKTPEEQIQYIAEIKNTNKQKADQLLTATDWTSIPAVGDPAQSNPYLSNQTAFLYYRSQVREIAVNPPETLVTDWPVAPAESWTTV